MKINRKHHNKYRQKRFLVKPEFLSKVKWLIQEKYGGQLTAYAKKDISRLEKGEPVDYLIGFIDFLGCKIDLSKRTLIPRVETEFWVEEIIKEIKNKKSLFFGKAQGKISNRLEILDIFAGSGCVGLAVLKHIEGAKMVFVDSEKNCLEQIKINLKINKIPRRRYEIIKSDVFKNLKSGGFDYILANPPYIANNIKSRLKIQESVLNFEPHPAIFGGEDGLFYIKRFLTEAKNFLKHKGEICMEFSPDQKEKIKKIVERLKYGKTKFFKDQYGRWRYAVIEQI